MTKNKDISKPFKVIERQTLEVENVVEKNKYFTILFFSKLYTQLDTNCQTFDPAVRKHSRSFLWCFECYAGLTSGECMANGLTNAIRHQFAMIAK